MMPRIALGVVRASRPTHPYGAYDASGIYGAICIVLRVPIVPVVSMELVVL